MFRSCVTAYRLPVRLGPEDEYFSTLATRNLPEFGNANHNCLGPKGCKTGSMLHTFKLARLRFTALSRHAAHFAGYTHQKVRHRCYHPRKQAGPQSL
jgi:hypothetical protein